MNGNFTTCSAILVGCSSCSWNVPSSISRMTIAAADGDVLRDHPAMEAMAHVQATQHSRAVARSFGWGWNSWIWSFHHVCGFRFAHFFRFEVSQIRFFPESVWAQGSSNSGGLYLIFSTSHLLIFTSSHLHTFSSSHLLIFTSSHLQIFSPSHLLIFTSSHLHIFSSSHLFIFTSAHLHIFLSSHLLIFTSAHLHISIFTYSHLLFLSLSLSPLSSLLSLSPFSLPFLSLAFFIFLSLGRGWCRRGVTKREPFRTKWGLIGENWGKIAILLVPEQPFRTKWGSIGKNWGKITSLLVPEQRFRTKWGSIGENWSKIAILLVLEQLFRTKRWSIGENWEKCDFTCAGATLSHEMRVDRQKLR